jgi:ribonuclease VapC
LIVIDTSALMAIVQDEPSADACQKALLLETELAVSAATLTECLIVTSRRGCEEDMRALVDGLKPEIVPITPAQARRVAAAYAQWGKGVHAAGLNFGDCFAYTLARDRRCALLFVGQDFGRTDAISAIPPA